MMLSERSQAADWNVEDTVLILVVVDDGLGAYYGTWSANGGSVLILVVVDDGLGDSNCDVTYAYLEESLNPCCSG